jgi:hypothetical protein
VAESTYFRCTKEAGVGVAEEAPVEHGEHGGAPGAAIGQTISVAEEVVHVCRVGAAGSIVTRCGAVKNLEN